MMVTCMDLFSGIQVDDDSETSGLSALSLACSAARRSRYNFCQELGKADVQDPCFNLQNWVICNEELHNNDTTIDQVINFGNNSTGYCYHNLNIFFLVEENEAVHC